MTHYPSSKHFQEGPLLILGRCPDRWERNGTMYGGNEDGDDNNDLEMVVETKAGICL